MKIYRSSVDITRPIGQRRAPIREQAGDDVGEKQNEAGTKVLSSQK